MKKEIPKNGLEEDVCSKYARSIYCYVQNTKGLTKWVKRKMNKRFRKRAKLNLKHDKSHFLSK